jgi:hypothetical protein
VRRKIQDGAFAENNPVRTAVREARTVAPSTLPAFVVSLGTGSSSSGPFSERLWGRLLDYLDKSLDSRSIWASFTQDHPELQRQGRLIRFDIDATHRVRLDAVDEIPRLKQQTQERYTQSPGVPAPDILMVKKLGLVNMFYFELMEDPDEVLDGFLAGYILCHWTVGQEDSEHWWEYIRSQHVQIFVNGRLHGTLDTDCWGNIHLPLQIPFNEETTMIRVEVQLGDFPPTDIGNSPFSVADLRKWHGFDDPFGSCPGVARKRTWDEPQTRSSKKAGL